MFQVVWKHLVGNSSRPRTSSADAFSPQRPIVRTTTWMQHFAVLFLAGVGVCWVFQPWNLSLSRPLAYSKEVMSDMMSIVLWTKSIIDEGWWMTNQHVGAPGGLYMHDYPTGSNVHFLALKILTVITKDPIKLITIYYFLTFPLAAWSAFFVLRRLGLAYGNSLIGGLLFAFTYFHFFRGTPHLLLSGYQYVPLMCLIWVWMIEERSYLVGRNAVSGRLSFLWRDGRTWGTLGIMAAVTSDFPYTPLFAILLLIPATIYSVSLFRTKERAFAGLVVGAMLVTGFLLNMAPTFIYKLQNGPNTSGDLTAIRSWTDSERFGLKLIQLFLPCPEHPIAAMRKVRNDYYAKTAIPSEADSMSMGLAASTGLIWLLMRLFWSSNSSQRDRTLKLFSLLTIGAFLIGGIGGIGTILNFFNFPSARCFSRISIFIVFFSIASFAFLLQPLLDSCREGSARLRIGVAGFLLAVLLGGMYDQVGTLAGRDWQGDVTPTFDSDRNFVRRVEASVPPGSMIFQFPQLTWLSYQNVKGRMQPYDHLRGYVHSKNLRWSFGAMCGRETDRCHHLIAGLPLEQSVEMLATWGFQGIYVDRHGYADPVKEIEAPLAALLRATPIVSDNGRLLFYPLTNYREQPEFKASEARRTAELNRVFASPRLTWKSGAYDEEPDFQGKPYRWCVASGSIEIENPLDRPVHARLSFATCAQNIGEYSMSVRANNLSRTIPVTHVPTRHTLDLILPPKTSRLDWTSDVPGVEFPQRTIHFMLIDVKCEKMAD